MVGFLWGIVLMYAAWAFSPNAKCWRAKECTEVHTHMKYERKSLPEVCAPFYNDGTGRWARCMGVGPK